MELKKTFTDARGITWSPKFSTPVLLRCCDQLDLCLEDFQDIGKTNLSKLMGLLFFACEDQAKGYGITRDVFWREHIPLSLLNVAVEALAGALTDAFPQKGDAKIEGGASVETRPLETGGGETF